MRKDTCARSNRWSLWEKVAHVWSHIQIWTSGYKEAMGESGWRLKSYIYFTSIVPAPEQERNVNPETKDVSACYLDSLWLLGMKVTAPNLTRRDGNLSDTLNNLLMQKLKGLSVSLGGREDSKVGYIGADIWTRHAWRYWHVLLFWKDFDFHLFIFTLNQHIK